VELHVICTRWKVLQQLLSLEIHLKSTSNNLTKTETETEARGVNEEGAGAQWAGPL
jgi:hypothetical protein